jgi:hypothetical protein
MDEFFDLLRRTLDTNTSSHCRIEFPDRVRDRPAANGKDKEKTKAISYSLLFLDEKKQKSSD